MNKCLEELKKLVVHDTAGEVRKKKGEGEVENVEKGVGGLEKGRSVEKGERRLKLGGRVERGMEG